MSGPSGNQLVLFSLESCFPRLRLGKQQNSRENKANCLTRDLTLSVYWLVYFVLDFHWLFNCLIGREALSYRTGVIGQFEICNSKLTNKYGLLQSDYSNRGTLKIANQNKTLQHDF